MDDERTPPRNGNGLSLSGWWGTVKAHGRDVVLILLLFAGFGLIWTTLRDRFAVLAGDRDHRTAEHLKILAAQNELACVLVMPQEARPEALSDPQGICHYVTMIYRFQIPQIPRKP